MTSGSVLIVDHTSVPGGAELGLPRIARHSNSDLQFLFLEPGFDRLDFPEGAAIIGPEANIGIFDQLKFLRRHLGTANHAAVVSNTLRAAVLVSLLRRGIPHFLYLHDGADAQSLSFIKRGLLRYLVMPRVTHVFPNSRWSGKSLGNRYAQKVSEPIYSPSGDRELSSQQQSSTEGRPSLRLLSLSRVVEWKGIHILIEALNLLASKYEKSQLTLTVAGGHLMGPDSYLQSLMDQAASLPFAVEFVGHQDNIGDLLDSHDVLVHASIRPEPFGQVIVQGLSAGMVVIASDAGGPAEIVSHGESGLLHIPGNARSLAAQIERLLDNPGETSSLQLGGTNRAIAFSDPVVVALFDEKLAAALSEGELTRRTRGGRGR